jgi:hypothetical protein
MEFLNSLSLAQWIFILIGIAIAGSSFWPSLKDKIYDWQKSKNQIDNRLNTDDCVTQHDLTNLVCKWECLTDSCEYMGLEAACEKLYEVFPLLIQVREEDDEEIDNEV